MDTWLGSKQRTGRQGVGGELGRSTTRDVRTCIAPEVIFPHEATARDYEASTKLWESARMTTPLGLGGDVK